MGFNTIEIELSTFSCGVGRVQLIQRDWAHQPTQPDVPIRTTDFIILPKINQPELHY